ncbi:Clavaminate synthase-like protein [Aspergillus heteromorphus CBS 117.55]|uniref:Clavaminate synthase-like protein n=1 Tax=Aspergillus heteromorphus CBS 117.55 TaxID=1448321 RepID=A0A317WF33_9EURO|nr:Clavaminate synthase-like protein [Aspergillus heteromorphus CBS 117.55]PWY85086.1 Clavaminate synthase-like protein [Aspergillus heteromorphus CBS 117.55]
MASVASPCPVPSVSYVELLDDDKNIRDHATERLLQALNFYGARPFFERPLNEKVTDHANSGTTSLSRFVPFASEKIRGKAHLDETVEFQHGVYDLAGNWSVSGRELLDASRPLHDECNRVQFHLFDCLSSSLKLPRPLSSLHSHRNSFIAPYYYCFDGDQDTETLRVDPHLDPTTMLFCFQDSYSGLEVADMSNQTGKLSTTAIQRTAPFIPVTCQPGEFVLLVGHVLRRLVGEVKHSVHRVKRPLGTPGFHLNYWTVPDLETSCDFGDKKEDVAEYLARVFPTAFGNRRQGMVSLS